jgi:hypothetical protein
MREYIAILAMLRLSFTVHPLPALRFLSSLDEMYSGTAIVYDLDSERGVSP